MTAVRSTVATLVVEIISVWQQSQGWQKILTIPDRSPRRPSRGYRKGVRASGRTHLASSVSSVCNGLLQSAGLLPYSHPLNTQFCSHTQGRLHVSRA